MKEEYGCALQGAEAWVRDGLPCLFREGPNGKVRRIRQTEARALLNAKDWAFNAGLKKLSFPRYGGVDYLEFIELNRHDLE